MRVVHHESDGSLFVEDAIFVNKAHMVVADTVASIAMLTNSRVTAFQALSAL